jgi:hypothetical protein
MVSAWILLGRAPDVRPVVRETLPLLGDLALAFDFDRMPRAPLILDPTPGETRAR